MRYRIVIEVDTNESRSVLNQLAERMYYEAVTKYSNPVYLSTEMVEPEPQILRQPEGK